jgi:hypothetical protein
LVGVSCSLSARWSGKFGVKNCTVGSLSRQHQEMMIAFSGYGRNVDPRHHATSHRPFLAWDNEGPRSVIHGPKYWSPMPDDDQPSNGFSRRSRKALRQRADGKEEAVIIEDARRTRRKLKQSKLSARVLRHGFPETKIAAARLFPKEGRNS